MGNTDRKACPECGVIQEVRFTTYGGQIRQYHGECAVCDYPWETYSDMTPAEQEANGGLHEACDDCDWEDYWNGGIMAEDPGLAHARKTGHTVTGRVVGRDE